MNRKTSALCFVFLFFFLICAASAADEENETVKTIAPDLNDTQGICTTTNEEPIQVKSIENDKMELAESQPVSSKKDTKQKVILKAPDVTMHYRDGHKFSVTLKDKNKKPISNAKIQISINGASYNKITDKKGRTSINLNLKSGKYVAVTTFGGTSKLEKQSIKSAITIKSTIKCGDLTKYYKNAAAYQSVFYDQKGRLLKNAAMQFKLNGKKYSAKTNKYGAAKLNIDLKPGKYSISSINLKTSETISKSITIKTLIQTKDLAMKEGDGSKFNVKVLNSYGKASPNKKVTLKVNGKTYVKTTDKNGIASLPIELENGKYSITTEYEGLKATNQITVNKVIKNSPFTYSIKIPNYVNITLPYVFRNSAYSIKTGINGIVKLPKVELFEIQTDSKTYKFSSGDISGYDAINIGYNYYLIPFDNGGIKSDVNKNVLKGNGILIYRNGEYTQIDYIDSTRDNVELFGMYADKGLDGFETITFLKNDKVTSKINFKTLFFDETGLKYSLSKYYGTSNLNYNDVDLSSITFTKTGDAVTFSMFRSYVVGYISQEDIITSFKINGKEELEKIETISYGLSEKYRRTLGFEVLQTYSIINEKITQKTLENWISKNPSYLNRFGVMNVYGMHLACLETAWLADELANKYSKEFNVGWKRENAVTILGGINLEDTYLHILNANMGMAVSGAEKNAVLFRLINSLNLPNLEDYAFTEVKKRFWDNTTNSQDAILTSIANNTFSVAQLGKMLYVFSRDGTSAIALDIESGVSNVLLHYNNNTYKGSAIKTSNDCCSVGMIPQDTIKGIRDTMKLASNGLDSLTNHLNNIHPLSVLAYKGISFILAKALSGAPTALLSISTAMVLLQEGGVKYRDKMISEDDWHSAMDTVAFTRPGYLQSKKIYNIPNNDGGYDYIEVSINNDLTLDRNTAKYITKGNTRQLTKEETYQYFSDDYWTPFSMPAKYWDESWEAVT